MFEFTNKQPWKPFGNIYSASNMLVIARIEYADYIEGVILDFYLYTIS